MFISTFSCFFRKWEYINKERYHKNVVIYFLYYIFIIMKIRFCEKEKYIYQFISIL